MLRGLYVSSEDAFALQQTEDSDYNSGLPLDSKFSVFGVNSNFSLISA